MISSKIKKGYEFSSSTIPNNVLKNMIGNSIPKKKAKDFNIEDLSYMKITYWGFDDKSHIGEMIVNKEVSEEVLDIFKEAFENKYPIQKMKLIDKYKADDEKSMEDNNTSAFCYRLVVNSKKLSKHSLGMAIDVNPLYNPYIIKDHVYPANGIKYVDRTFSIKGMIKKGDILYNAFIKRGWKWGGEWTGKKDYQHFEK